MKKLSVSDHIEFKSIDQVVMDFFDIRKKDGSKFNRNYFRYRPSNFKISENETIWFHEFTNNEKLACDNETLEKIPIKRSSKKEKSKKKDKDYDENLYIFAKLENNLYRFIGKFQVYAKPDHYHEVSKEFNYSNLEAERKKIVAQTGRKIRNAHLEGKYEK